jgi:hypothetical protein
MDPLNRGLVFFNRGTRCVARLLVCLWTLRKHYAGPVTVLHEGTFPEWAGKALKHFRVDTKEVPATDGSVLAGKSKMWRNSPYRHTMFMDADMIVRGPVDEFLDAVEKHGLVLPTFCGWKTTGRKMSTRIAAWDHIVPDLVKAAQVEQPAINTGVIGWTAGNRAMEDYEALTLKGNSIGEVHRKTLDEIAMQLVITQHPHHLMGPEWNDSCVYGNPETARIIHFHGQKHLREPNTKYWKEAFWELVANVTWLSPKLKGESGDPSIDEWFRRPVKPVSMAPVVAPPVISDDLTIVTAVNPAYADKCRANLTKWLQTPGLKERKFIVFVNGFTHPRDRAFLNHPQVQIVRWHYPHAASVRETMLAAFVMGTAEHVKTPYWMKLDCDTRPTEGRFDAPEYRNAAITSHSWGYTKMKCDDNVSDHWFNRMDRLFATPETKLFHVELSPEKDKKVTHRPGNPHNIPMRFASFAHIQQTEFTKRVANEIKAKSAGKLPIPSHDTLTWYFAALWKEKMNLVNMKEWFQP